MNKNTRKNRVIFDDDFYRFGAITLTDKFKRLEAELKQKYALLGLPIPKKGFSTHDEYRQWIKKVMKMTSSKNRPGTLLGNILKTFNLNPTNETYRNGLVGKVFFNKPFGKQFIQLKNNIDLIWQKSPTTKELIVKIYPWTKRKDYMNLWLEIKKAQKLYPNYRGKEKYQTTFERDFEVYKLFLKTRSKHKDELGNKSSVDSIINKMADDDSYHLLAKKFKNENIDNKIRIIISKFNKLLKNVSIT